MAFLQIVKNDNGFTATGKERFDYCHADNPDIQWNWDGMCLHLRNDRFGIYPVFYYVAANRIVVSTSIREILSKTGILEYDYEAIAIFLRMGHFIGNDTALLDIKRLSPNSVLTWNGRLTVHNDEVITEKEKEYSYEEAIRHFGIAFEDVVGDLREMHPKRTLRLPLSGGADSRHILLACESKGILPASTFTINTGIENSEDLELANQLSAHLAVPHLELPSFGGAARSTAEIQKNMLCQFATLDHAWYLAARKYLLDVPEALVFDGLAGDVLSAGHRLEEGQCTLFQKGSLNELADALLPNNEDFLKTILTRRFYQRVNRNIAICRLIPELTRWSGEPNPMVQFIFWNRTCLSIALQTTGIIPKHTIVEHPFLDSRVFDFLIGLPQSFFFDKQFHRLAIKRAYPRVANVPFAARKSPNVLKGDRAAEMLQLITFFLECGQSDMVKLNRTIARTFAKYVLGRSNVDLMGHVIYLVQLQRVQRGCSPSVTT